MFRYFLILIQIFFLPTYNIFGQDDVGDKIRSGKKIYLNKILEIGIWEGNEQEIFYKIQDVKTDNSNNIYILDSGNYRIQKFNVHGKYICSIGNKGQGPGEFNNPVMLHQK